MYNYDYYNFFDKKIISKNNRFKLSLEQNNEIKKKFYNSNILIIGAAGSIGSVFTLSMINYNFKKLFLIDKDENNLTELNREILVKNKKTVKKIEFICSDLNLLDLRKIILENKINHYLNFAAIKHVRSEENYVSSKYMYQTNSKNFLPNGLRNVKTLKSIFSISTDKAVYPSSMLGVSKRLMELRLMRFKKRYKNLFVSTVRFANVSFSNGSILKLIIDRLVQKKNFGIPENISRYFITHDEAVSLCLKSILKKNNYCIVVPNKEILGKQTLIFTYLLKILKILNIKVKRKINFFQRNLSLQKIYLVKGKIVGQKAMEKINYNHEEISPVSKDKTIFKIKYDKKNYSKEFTMLEKIEKKVLMKFLSKNKIYKKDKTHKITHVL